MKTIFAHTDTVMPADGSYVPYVNLTEADDLSVRLSVRSMERTPADPDGTIARLSHAVIALDDVTLGQLAWAINQHLGRRDAGALPDFRARVVDECSEIKGRLSRLEAFMLTATFYGLPGDEQTRMRSQFAAMCSYWSILDERIRNFPDAPPAVATTEKPL